MKKGILAFLLMSFIGGLTLTSCEQCMTCEINYTKTNGNRVTERSPQKCGFSGQLDAKKDELEEAYSAYDSLDIDCNRGP